MKKYEEYQHLEGEPMNDRDKDEIGSKFWNDGKWDNFVLPFLPKKPEEMTFIDVGCNAGLFLKKAKDFGFNTVIGVDSNRGAIEKGRKWRDKNNCEYTMMETDMEKPMAFLPTADYTSLVNVHYYFKEDTWKEYLKELEGKTRFCIIVTADKKPKPGFAKSDIAGIREDFKDWDEVGYVDIKPGDGKHDRHLHGLCFRSNVIDRAPVKMLDNGNGQIRDFFTQYDISKDPFKTDYYRRYKSYRSLKSSGQNPWSIEKLHKYFEDIVTLYKQIKQDGLHYAIDVNSKHRIVDGNHRAEIAKHLGYETILIKRISKKLKGAIVYYSSNKEDPEFENKIIQDMLSKKGDLQVYSVTQKPMDLGTNLCVGEEIGTSGFNVCRQLQKAVEMADADYIISCEADCLYSPDYFTFIPPEKKIYRNTNNYILPYESDVFYKKDFQLAFQVADKKTLLDRLTFLFKGQPEWDTGMRNFPKEIGEPFLDKWEKFSTENPCFGIKTGDGLRKQSNHEKIAFNEIPYWGEAKGIREKYL